MIDDLQGRLQVVATYLEHDDAVIGFARTCGWEDVTFADVVRRAAHLLKSHEGNGDFNRAKEERQAWDRYISAGMASGLSVEAAAGFADLILDERRKRFATEPKKEEGNTDDSGK